MRWFVCFAAMSLALAAESDDAALLAKIKAKVIDEVHRIPRYVCRQRIERRVSLVNTRPGVGCSALIEVRARDPEKNLRFESVDRARLDVMLADGGEFFSWPGEHKFESNDPSKLLPGGMSGAGDFAGFLEDIFDRQGPIFKYRGPCGKAACVRFEYEVPQGISRFKMTTDRDTFISGYKGIVDADPQTADLLELTVRPTYMRDPQICQTETEMKYTHAKSDAGEFMIPESSERTALFVNGNFLANKTSYEGCRQYTAESVLKFDDDSGAPSPAAKNVDAPRTPPPPGTVLKLRLITPVDSQINAAGDAVEAAVVQAVRDSSGRVLAAANTVVRGHLTQVELNYLPATAVQMSFSSIVLGGSEIPIRLKPAPQKNVGIAGGTFVFKGKRTTLGKTFVSAWIVQAP